MPLPWFRRKTRPEETAPSSAATEVPYVEPLTVDEPAKAPGPDGQSSPTDPNAPKKRRRGTRGGRNRKKKPVDGAATADGAESTPRERAGTERKSPERKPAEKKAADRKPREQRSGQPARRRQAPKRAP
ncbi:MAG: hypothetical protein WAU41_11370, partial [Gaiellaceae bacterium]